MFIPMRAGSQLETAKAAIAISREPARRQELIDDLVDRLYVPPAVAEFHPLSRIIEDATGETPVYDDEMRRGAITRMVDLALMTIASDNEADEWEVLLAEWEAEIVASEGRVQ